MPRKWNYLPASLGIAGINGVRIANYRKTHLSRGSHSRSDDDRITKRTCRYLMYLLRALPIICALSILFVAGCDTPDSVSQFCSSAVTTLSSVTSVLADLEGSCLREVNTTHDLGTFTLPATSDPNCATVGTQAAAAQSAAKLLSEYFNTINSLASVGTAKASTDASALATNAAGAFDAGSAAKTAIGAIAQDLTSGVMTVYQSRKLAQDLPKASNDVSAIIDALVKIIQNNYIAQELADEEKKLPNPYKAYLSGHNSPELAISLEQKWQADEQALQGRRAAAQSAITALQAVSKGFSDLANNANHLKAKEIPGLLDPYVSQIQSLIPEIQKAF
jgi:hypothetical protein